MTEPLFEMPEGRKSTSDIASVPLLRADITPTREAYERAEKLYLENHRFPMNSWTNVLHAERKKWVKKVLEGADLSASLFAMGKSIGKLMTTAAELDALMRGLAVGYEQKENGE